MTPAMTKIERIPEHIMEQARALVAQTGNYPDSITAIAQALLAAEKRGEERNKAFWQKWAHKRRDISRTQWLKAAKTALAGDIRDLRLRVELAEAPPVEIVASDDGN